MSKENAKKFFNDVSANEDLKKTLLDSPAQAWVASAKKAGYDVTVDDVADELISTIRGMVSGELNDGSLDAVTGGAGVAAAPVRVAAGPQVSAAANLKMAPGLKLPGKGAARW